MTGFSSGGQGGVALSTLLRKSVLPNRRLPHVLTAIGDSRIAAIYIDPAKRNLAVTAPLNWANAMLGQRLVIGDTFGVSGDRTDQMLARLSGAIATGAGLLYIQGGINDIAQNYPTAGTSGATAFANIRAMAEAARAAGMIIVIEAEVGGNGLNSVTFVTQANELNALLYEYAERTPGVYVHDARLAVMQPAWSDTALQYKAGYSYDGTHVNGRGALYWGESLSALLGAIVPPRFGPLLRNRIALPGNGRRQLCTNPLFVTATGGTLQNGATGIVPAGWTGYRSNALMGAVFSSQPDSGGLGNNVVMDMVFAAAGDEARLYQAPANSSWQAGDVVEGFADVQLTGTPAGLAGLYLQLTAQVDAVSYDNMDLYPTVGTGFSGPDKGVSLTLRTRPFTVPAYTVQNWMQVSVRAIASGAGGCQLIVRQMGVRRRDAA